MVLLSEKVIKQHVQFDPVKKVCKCAESLGAWGPLPSHSSSQTVELEAMFLFLPLKFFFLSAYYDL